MRDHFVDIAPVTVVVVTFTERARLAGYVEHLSLPFAVLSDELREFYRAYELGRGSWARVYGWRTMRVYRDLMRKGRRMRRPTEDTLQLGGDFVIDSAGRLAWQHHAAGPDDRPPVSAIVEAVRRARTGS